MPWLRFALFALLVAALVADAALAGGKLVQIRGNPGVNGGGQAVGGKMEDYLTKDGKLTNTLEIRHDTLKAPKAGTPLTYSFTVERDGSWSAVTMVGKKNQQKITGKLGNDNLAMLAKELARYDTLNLKTMGVVTDLDQVVAVKFGTREATLIFLHEKPLPSANPEANTWSMEQRYAGILEAVRKAIGSNPDHYLTKDGKLLAPLQIQQRSYLAGKGPALYRKLEVSVETDGKWRRSTWTQLNSKSSNKKETNGILTKAEIAGLAEVLAKCEYWTMYYNLNGIGGSDSYHLSLRFGAMSKVFMGGAPPSSDAKANKVSTDQRFAIILEAVLNLTAGGVEGPVVDAMRPLPKPVDSKAERLADAERAFVILELVRELTSKKEQKK